LIEVLLLHRQHPHAAVVAGIEATVAAGSCSPELVAIEARKHTDNPALAAAQTNLAEAAGDDEPVAWADPDQLGDAAEAGARVISLHSRRLHTGQQHRPKPVSIYDQLLKRSRGNPA
jgi:hypothetical protein